MSGPTGARLTIGTRVRLTTEGRKLYWNARLHRRLGHVVGYSRDGHPGVHWDGLSERTVYHYHPTFIEKVGRAR